MKLNRFYCENIAPGAIQLDSTESHHLTNVMRQHVGDEVEVFDGNGTIAAATVAEITRKAVAISVKTIEKHDNNHPKVIIAASIAKGQRFDWLISKCTELGVDHIFPVIFERTVKQAKGASGSGRLDKLAITAAKQCRRIFLPELSSPNNLKTALSVLKTQYPDAKFLFGHFSQNAIPLCRITYPAQDVIAFIGPEGGLTESELLQLKDANATETSLTKTILRIETAAIAFASTLCITRDTI
ncbi:MAG: 16S rRNA (uracil(1498)-N(3))-methyltransferase [Anaerohalosphaera sp.]|nr:16S rRNA (uracil(1498)-N(3))-methyltransferase [Anaerohalosphaera sp.]